MGSYQWEEAWVEQQLGVLHPHGQDWLPLVGPVVCGELSVAQQGGSFHQAVHVDREHFHGVGQDQLHVDKLSC